MEFSLLACICFHMLYATITLRLETNEVRCNTPAATDSTPLPALALNLSLAPNAQSMPKLPLPLFHYVVGSYIPYLIFMVNKPCCPNNISLKKVNTPNHTIGVMSTPKAGGTAPRISLSKGSVGHTAKANGNSLRLVVGYHDMTTRHSMAKENMLRNGPRTLARGWTQGSVSERRRVADWTASTYMCAVVVTSATGRTFRLVVETAAAVDVGGTKAAHPEAATARAADRSNNLEGMV